MKWTEREGEVLVEWWYGLLRLHRGALTVCEQRRAVKVSENYMIY